MSELSRSTILRGPGLVVYDSTTIHTVGDVTAAPEVTRFDVQTSRSGVVDQRVGDAMWKVGLTPAGVWNTTLLGKLFPHLNPTIGASVFGASDRALSIAGVNQTTGNKITLSAAAVTKCPAIIPSAGKTLFGAMEFTGLRTNDSAWSTDNTLVTVGNETVSAADADRDDILTQPYDAAWGSLLADIETETGWTISTELRFAPVTTDRQGTVDMTVEGVSVLAKCVPVAATLTNIVNNMPLQGTSMARGVSTRTRSDTLTISGTGVEVVLNHAALVQGGFRFGGTTLRQNEVGFVAHRTISTGVYGALMTLGTGE